MSSDGEEVPEMRAIYRLEEGRLYIRSGGFNDDRPTGFDAGWKWDEARDHAMRAVVADNRMRIWYADKASMELGLLFTCRLGNVDLDRPVGKALTFFHF